MGRQVTVARVLRAHGIAGEVVVSRAGDTAGVLERGSVLHGHRGALEVTLTVAAARRHKQNWIVAFEGVRDRNEAEALAGIVFTMDADALPALGEGTYYQFQLVGLAVVTAGGEGLGKIEEIWETGANDVLVVRGPRGEILIPAVERFVRAVDVEAGRVTVDHLEGLLPEEDEP